MKFPPPQTFPEGQRAIYGMLMAAAGIAYSIAVLCGVAIVVWGVWPEELAKLRLYILAGAIGGGTVGSVCVTIALAVGGPVGRFSVRAGKEGAELSAHSDVTTTTTTETR